MTVKSDDRPNMKYIEYSGMSYLQASKEAERVIKKLGWFLGFDRLEALRAIMLREVAEGTKAT